MNNFFYCFQFVHCSIFYQLNVKRIKSYMLILNSEISLNTEFMLASVVLKKKDKKSTRYICVLVNQED